MTHRRLGFNEVQPGEPNAATEFSSKHLARLGQPKLFAQNFFLAQVAVTATDKKYEKKRR